MGLLEEDKTSVIMWRVTCCIALTHSIAIFIYHTFSIFSHNKIKSITRVRWLSILSLMITICMQLIAIFLAFGQHQLDCKWYTVSIGLSWAIAKYSLYILLLERLFRIFAGSSLKFKRIHVFISRSLLSFWLLLSIIIFVLFVDGKPNEYVPTVCAAHFPFWINVFAGNSDITICCIICISLSRRLLELNVSITESEQTTDINTSITKTLMNNQMYRTLIRSSLLSFIALLTTQTSILLMAIIGLDSIWMSLDFMVNGWCVVLMFSAHNTMYTLLCGYCERMISMKCISCISCACWFKIKPTTITVDTKSVDNSTSSTANTDNKIGSTNSCPSNSK
eukprot:524529_1